MSHQFHTSVLKTNHVTYHLQSHRLWSCLLYYLRAGSLTRIRIVMILHNYIILLMLWFSPSYLQIDSLVRNTIFLDAFHSSKVV